jgi:hypothetical protein
VPSGFALLSLAVTDDDDHPDDSPFTAMWGSAPLVVPAARTLEFVEALAVHPARVAWDASVLKLVLCPARRRLRAESELAAALPVIVTEHQAARR